MALRKPRELGGQRESWNDENDKSNATRFTNITCTNYVGQDRSLATVSSESPAFKHASPIICSTVLSGTVHVFL